MGLDEVRTEGYLLGSPGRDTRGFRDPLRSEDPNLPCLASSSPTLALPAPPGTVPLLLPPPPEPPTAPEVSQEGNRKRKAREWDLLNEYAAEEPHESEGIPLLASQARPRGTAEPPIPPSRESSPQSQPSRARSQRPQRRPRREQYPVRKADWDPIFRQEFEWYLHSERAFRRQFWTNGTMGRDEWPFSTAQMRPSRRR